MFLATKLHLHCLLGIPCCYHARLQAKSGWAELGPKGFVSALEQAAGTLIDQRGNLRRAGRTGSDGGGTGGRIILRLQPFRRLLFSGIR